MQAAIHPTIRRIGKSLWDKAVGPTSRETNIETKTKCWEDVERFIELNLLPQSSEWNVGFLPLLDMAPLSALILLL